MTILLARTAAAELIKLRGLPAVVAVALGTVVAFGAAGRGVTQVVPLLQAGPILLGVLAVATEYAGRQIATTLTATPNRLRLLAAKTVAYLIAATATVGAGLAAAWATRLAGSERAVAGWPMAGAAVYLVLIGLLALGLAAVLRSLIPPLAGLLTLVLIVSPLLAGQRWDCLLYTSPSPRDQRGSRMPSSA